MCVCLFQEEDAIPFQLLSSATSRVTGKPSHYGVPSGHHQTAPPPPPPQLSEWCKPRMSPAYHEQLSILVIVTGLDIGQDIFSRWPPAVSSLSWAAFNPGHSHWLGYWPGDLLQMTTICLQPILVIVIGLDIGQDIFSRWPPAVSSLSWAAFNPGHSHWLGYWPGHLLQMTTICLQPIMSSFQSWS